MKVWLLPPNPGPFGTLQQWTAWRDELVSMGPDTPGVDTELEIARHAIADLVAESESLQTA